VLAQVEANELSSAGEALEVERDKLLEQVTELTTERDRLMGKLEQQAADIKAQAERIEREQQSAEAARVVLSAYVHCWRLRARPRLQLSNNQPLR